MAERPRKVHRNRSATPAGRACFTGRLMQASDNRGNSAERRDLARRLVHATSEEPLRPDRGTAAPCRKPHAGEATCARSLQSHEGMQGAHTDSQVRWMVIIHLVFVISGVLLAAMDWIANHARALKRAKVAKT